MAQDPTPGRGSPGVGPGGASTPRTPDSFFLRSSAFGDGARIPDVHTVVGDDRSPPLEWGNAPAGTQSFAIICEDIDIRGRPFVHWVIYAIPAETTSLPEGLPRDRELDEPAGARQGTNGFSKDRDGYRGPATPPGNQPHRYRFTIYALKGVPETRGGLTADALRQRMKDMILAEASFVGTFSRARRPGETPPGVQEPERPRGSAPGGDQGTAPGGRPDRDTP